MIWFNNKFALEQLTKYGEVYTVRLPRRQGRHLLKSRILGSRANRYNVLDDEGKKIWVTVTLEDWIDTTDLKGDKERLFNELGDMLEPYVEKSGFSSLGDWMLALLGIYHGSMSALFDRYCLYHVGGSFEQRP